MKTPEEIRFEREQLDYAERDFLRSRGWRYTSSTPGCYWLFEKEHEGRVLLVSRSTAIGMEEWWDEMRCECGEESEATGEADPACPVHGARTKA